MAEETIKEQPGQGPATRPASAPGLVVVFAAEKPRLIPIALSGGRAEIGRGELSELGIEDHRVSRRHLEVLRADTKLVVSDRGSTNGVFVGGRKLDLPMEVSPGETAVVRIGQTLLLLVWDVAPYEAAALRTTVQGGVVAGAALHAVHREITALGRAGQGLFIRGESGSGKEIAARVYHRAGPRAAGPFVAVNCAAIPKELAERLLFGAVRGAYSGAVADAQGTLQAAHGGTLFLDEVSELDLSVQAKLLRVLETREVIPLGGTRPQPVELGLCSATLKDLRECVAAGTFREDLYYRVGRPEVRVPPLRERLEEVPFLVDQTVRGLGLSPGASLVEECLLRPWPGNVRELCAEVRAAAVRARAGGSEEALAVHLDEQAGRRIRGDARAPSPLPGTDAPSSEKAEKAAEPRGEGVEALLGLASARLGLAQKTVLKLLPEERLRALRTAAEEEARLDAASLEARLRVAAKEALTSLCQTHQFNHTAVAAALGTSRTTLLKLIEDLGLPRAADLDEATIAHALEAANGDPEAAARALRISPAAFKKRLANRGPQKP